MVRMRLLTLDMPFVHELQGKVIIIIGGQRKKIQNPCQSNLLTGQSLGAMQGAGQSQEFEIFSEPINGKYIPTFVEVMASVPSDLLKKAVVIEVEETARLIQGDTFFFVGKIRVFFAN